MEASIAPSGGAEGAPPEQRHDEDHVKRTNPFSDFMSSSDIDELTRKKMLLEDRAQQLAKEQLRRNRTRLNDDLRAASPDALYENKVLFSHVATSQKESNPSWQWGTSKEMASTLEKKDNLMLSDVLQSRKNLRGSHRNMIDGNGDLGLLQIMAEQTKAKGTVKKGSKGDNRVSVEEEAQALIVSLRASEKRVIAKMGLSAEAIQKVGCLYVRFRGRDGLDKKQLQNVLQRKQKAAFSAEGFEDLWRSMLPMEKTSVSFVDLLLWASQYLPLNFEEKAIEDIEVSAEKRRAQSREREKQREAEEAAAQKQKIVNHMKQGFGLGGPGPVHPSTPEA
jgi:hypothetical protein